MAIQTPNQNREIAAGLAARKEKPLIFVNGKKVSQEEFNRIEPNQIKSFHAYKKKEAVKKYGQEAVHGVIEVKLK
jgi:hypothetical protein